MTILLDFLKNKCSETSLKKLSDINNAALHAFIAKYVDICNPDLVYVCNDSPEDRKYIRGKATELGEEKKLSTEGHTIHFDGSNDQARDKSKTKYLLPKGVTLGADLNAIDKDEGLNEITGFLKDSMKGREMLILFFCLGPTNSDFSIPCVQITDSSYVAHSEYILYRSGYGQFKCLSDSGKFFRFVHSAGELEGMASKNIDKRRVYIDLQEDTVYSTNTQYAGNTVGLKKLSLRLAINKAAKEDWLAEHMMIAGIKGSGDRITYFAGAFPSACGKTSTAMLTGETIVGDDIAYLRKKDGIVRGVNVECGIFGIIRDVNPEGDPVIWEALNTPGEVIVSNVLVTEEGNPFWLGDGRATPDKGINFSGEWHKGKKDAKGNDIPHAHKNARYTVSLYALKNMDDRLDDPNGVEIKGIIYGGRDSSIWPPVQQAFCWTHGVVTMGAALESETTAATLGKEGVRQFNPMSNLDFVAIPIGKYINKHLRFADGIKQAPSIFAVNYFLKDKNGEYLTGIKVKHVWIKWMELRVNNDVDAIKTPVGFIPLFEDIKKLFKDVLSESYSEEQYKQQFTLRIAENIEKIDRIKDIYKTRVTDTPEELFKILQEQKQRLKEAQAKHGNYIDPSAWQAV